MFAYAFTFLVALAVTFVLTPVVKNFAIRIGAVDKPDARKVYHGLIPRLGGLAIYAGFMVSVITTIGFTYEMVGIMVGATFLIAVGIADDVYSLPPKVKLLGQIIAAAIPVVIFNINIEWIDVPRLGIIYLPEIISLPLTIFWIIGFVNTVNRHCDDRIHRHRPPCFSDGAVGGCSGHGRHDRGLPCLSAV